MSSRKDVKPASSKLGGEEKIMQNLSLMAIKGGNEVNQILTPYFAWLNRIGIHFAPSPEDSLKKILEKLRDPIRWMISTIFLLGVIYFVYKAVLAGIPYFNAR